MASKAAPQQYVRPGGLMRGFLAGTRLNIAPQWEVCVTKRY